MLLCRFIESGIGSKLKHLENYKMAWKSSITDVSVKGMCSSQVRKFQLSVKLEHISR